MKRKTIIRVISFLLILIIIFLVIGKKKGWVGKKDSIKVSIEKVEKRSIIESVPANGRIQPEKEVKITPYISGEVVELYVIEGQDIKKGDLLAKIDPEIYLSNYERVKATLNTQKANKSNMIARQKQAEAQLLKSTQEFNRSKTLFNQSVISQAEFEQAQTTYNISMADVEASEQNVKAAQFTINSAYASLKEAKDNLNKTTVSSPINGTVSRLNVEKGERVAGASQFSAGTELMSIANLNSMEVNVEVSENDIVRVSINDTAIIEVDAYFDRKFKGIVTEIATSANTTNVSADQVTNFYVKIRILQSSYKDLLIDNNNQSPFRPGMSASVEIQTNIVDDILSVPIQSVTIRDDTTGKVDRKKEDADVQKKQEKYVFIVENEKATMYKVETGIQDNMYIEIKSGLDEGLEAITAPYSAINKKLKNGDIVKVVSSEKLFEK